MDKKLFFEKLEHSPFPVIVDFWAPWCGPCKMVKPILEKLEQEYTGRVDLWQINADDNQELLHELGIYGIPTLVIFDNGKEIQRLVGAKSAGSLKTLFETLATGGNIQPQTGMSGGERFIRIGVGLAIAGIAYTSNSNWFFLVLGGAIIFSAIYDRCPIWRALTAQLKKMTLKT